MRRVTLSEQESRMGPADVEAPLTDVLGLTHSAINYYELDPCESPAYGYHAHESQEEVFYVVEGELTFRTAEGDVAVSAGELVRFGPGEYQRGVNEGDDRVRVLAVGAPQEAGETDVRRHCASCEAETPQTLELADDRSAVVAYCEICGAETGRFT
ncbi:MAG: cupin domain-containing protein [Halobacteriaceae archaeon]